MTPAIHTNRPVRSEPLPTRPQYGIAERNAANNVIASGNLSGFIADPTSSAYRGGYHVQALEEAWCERFGVKHAIAMNSATSCLFGAIAILKLGPADRVLVTPWSMSASAICVLAGGAVPVFSDIELDTYAIGCFPPEPPKALVLVHLFGLPARFARTFVWSCRTLGIPVIEDASQAPGATYKDGVLVGTLGDIGVFSLNRHKQIQAGEGGIAVTNNDEYAQLLRAYRNHGEVLKMKKWFIGGNYRMGEVEAAIGKVQLERLDELVEPRRRNVAYLNKALAGLPGLSVPQYSSGPVWYLYPVRVANARKVAAALTAEGIPASTYVEPLFNLPVLRDYARTEDYEDWEDALYPHVTKAHRETVVIEHIHANMTEPDLQDIVRAFEKVLIACDR